MRLSRFECRLGRIRAGVRKGLDRLFFLLTQIWEDRLQFILIDLLQLVHLNGRRPGFKGISFGGMAQQDSRTGHFQGLIQLAQKCAVALGKQFVFIECLIQFKADLVSQHHFHNTFRRTAGTQRPAR